MPVTNFREFNQELIDFAEKLVPAQANQFFRLVALKILRGVVLKTPVDTGRARGNWQVAINTEPTAVLSKKDASSPKHKVGESPIAGAGEETVKDGVSDISKAVIGDTIFITNNVPYVLYLEEGTDKIPPQKMLAHTLQEVEAEFRETA